MSRSTSVRSHIFLPVIKGFLIISSVILMQSGLFAQMKGGIEQYSYIGKGTENSILPILHFESKKGWYVEARYNYEDQNTFSVYGGKSFSREGNFSWTATPMLGLVAGNYKGSSLALNLDAENAAGFFLSAQTQFTISFNKENDNFFYNWSELGYNVSSHFFTGLTLQYTRQSGINNIEPGVFAGIEFKNISFPFYVFNPFGSGRYFICGVNYEYTLNRKKIKN